MSVILHLHCIIACMLTWEGPSVGEEGKSYYRELFLSTLNMHIHVLDIVVYSVEHGALVYDHGLEFFEYVCELNDTLCDIVDLALALCDSCVVGSKVSYRGLL